MKKFVKKFWVFLAALIITLAILFSLFRALTPWAKQYKGQVEQQLTSVLGKSVEIENMQTSWYWFQPVLKLDNVDITTAQNKTVTLKKLLVGINLLKSLLSWQIQPGLLYIEDVKLTVRQKGQGFELDGFDTQSVVMNKDAYLPLLNWLLSQRKIIIKNADINLYLENGELLPLEQLNFAVSNQFGHYQLRGAGKLIQKIPTEIDFIGDLTSFGDVRNINGNIYLEVHNFYPARWQNLLSGKNFKINKGQGSAKFWFTLNKSQLKSIHSYIDLQDISLSKNQKTNVIKSFTANLLWNKQDDGWQLSADNINLAFNNAKWLNNKLKVKYYYANDSYELLISKLQLDPINTINIKWPDEVKNYLAYHPTGELNNLKVGIKDYKVNYFLAKFKNISWDSSEQIPGVKNLSGVLFWESEQGRLEIDSQDTTIHLHGKKPILFQQINAGSQWKLLSQGYRVSLDRLLVTRPDLVINIQGVIDALDKDINPLMNLTGQFSVDNPKTWLPYFSEEHIKPGLYDWLLHNVVKVDKVTGQWKLAGKLKDYPFDNNQGEFKITSYLQGVDLIYRKGWPVAQNIDAYLRLNRRDMDIDILNADIKGVSSNQINVKIYDIGNNREAVLLHGKISAYAKDFQKFIISSPLKEKLSLINKLDILGRLNLDLRIEAPLDREEIFTLGTLNFANNQITANEDSKIDFKNINGILKFDEKGILDGQILASLWADPIEFYLSSVRGKNNNALEIIFKGNSSVELLKDKFKLNVPFIDGNFNVLGTIKINDDKNVLNHLSFRTSLENVAIDLPTPLGKAREVTTPLNLDIAFKDNVFKKVRFNYDSRIKGDISITPKNLQGIIQFGDANLSRKISSDKIQITGFIQDIDFDAWYKFVNSLNSQSQDNNLIEIFEFNNLKLGSIDIFNNNFKDLLLNAEYSKNALILNLAHDTFEANVNYNSVENNLVGHINHLKLAEASSSGLHLSIEPKYIPNLNLTIDELQIGDLDLGRINLLSKTDNNNVHIKSLHVRSNIYDLLVNGDWNGDLNKTALNLKLHVKSVSNLLTHFNFTEITDAFEADTLDSNMQARWDGAIYDFAINKLAGDIHTVVKHGRISNFSPETEEKLGFAKLLSILSLQTIPRRLKLDFSDWSKDGYSFDVYKGNFVINNGIMKTKDSYIDGPVAYASIKGDIDLTRQSFDLNLHVSPHITASLPVVATIAGGPVAGIATWVVSKIVNQSMEKISGYTYKISGPWASPVVQQVNIIKSANKIEDKSLKNATKTN